MTVSPSTLASACGRLCAALVLSSLVILSGCDKINLRSESDYVQRARGQLAKGDYKAAIVEAKNALQKNPQNVDARLLLADALVRTGNGAEAEIALKQALDNGADEQVIAVSLGRAILLQNDYKRVLADVTVPPNASPAQSAKLLAIRGEALLEMGRFQDASKTFDQAVANDPQLPEGLVGKARVAFGARRFDESNALLQQVFDRAPGNIPALLVRGDIFRSEGKFDEATASYQKVLDVDPDNLIGLVKIASIEMGIKHFDEASKHIARIKEFAGAENIYLYLTAFLEFRKENYAAAREPIQKVLASAPDHLPSIALAGVIEYSLNSNEQAEKYLRQALAGAPNAPMVRKMLAATLTRTGQIPQAVELLKPALLQSPDDVSLLTLAGETFMKAGDFASASKYLAKAAALDPKSSDVRVQLGMSRLAAGDNEAALADLDTAMQSDEDQYKAEVLMIVATMNRKDYVQAMKSVELLQRKQPNNPLTYNFKGGVLLATKDVPGARAAFEKALSLDPTYVPAAINLGHLDVAENRPVDAKKRFIAILDKDPKKTEAALALVDLDQATKTPPAEIVAVLDRAIAADPRAVRPLVILSRMTVGTEPGKSLEAAQKAAAITPNDPDVLDALGQAQMATGEESGALATYTKLVELKPKAAPAMLRLASLLARNANPQAATRMLRKAIEVRPNYLEAQAALVSLELNAGHTAEALKVAKQVEAVDPQAPFGYLLEGDALMVAKAYAKAAASYEKAYSLNQNGGIAVKVHAALAAAGQPALGETRLKEWIARSPDDLGARYYLASAAAGRKNFPLAIEQYQAILQKKPDDPVTLNDLAATYDQAMDPRALATAEAAYKSKPDEAPINDTLGWMLIERGQTERGLQLLRAAARSAPQIVEIRLHLVQALLKSGDKNAARVELEAVVNRRENFPQRRDAEKLLASLQADS